MHSEGWFFMRHDHFVLLKMRRFWRFKKMFEYMFRNTFSDKLQSHAQNLAPFFLLNIAWRHHAYYVCGLCLNLKKNFLISSLLPFFKAKLLFLKNPIFIMCGWVVFWQLVLKGFNHRDKYLIMHDFYWNLLYL